MSHSDGVGVILSRMQDTRLTDAHLAAIPPRNLRVPRQEFIAVWLVAEHLDHKVNEGGTRDWYPGGVAVTCRWMAHAVVTSSTGRRMLPVGPVTHREAWAYEELIEQEFEAAERLAVRRPAWLEHRPGWVEGICATLRWAWRHSGPAPLAVPTDATAGWPAGQPAALLPAVQ